MSIFTMQESSMFARALASQGNVEVKQSDEITDPYSDTDGTIHIGTPSIYNESAYMGSLHREISKQCGDMTFFQDLDVSKNPLQNTCKNILQAQRTEYNQEGIYEGRDRILSDAYDQNIRDAGGIKKLVKGLGESNATVAAMIYLGNEMRNDWSKSFNYCDDIPANVKEEVDRLETMLEEDWLELGSTEDLSNLLERIQNEGTQQEGGDEEGSSDTGEDKGSSDTGEDKGSSDTGEDKGSSDTGEDEGVPSDGQGVPSGEEGSSDTGEDKGSSDTGEDKGSSDTGEDKGSSDTGEDKGSSDTGEDEGVPSDGQGVPSGEEGSGDPDTQSLSEGPRGRGVGATDAYESLKSIGLVKEPSKLNEYVQPDRVPYQPRSNDLETIDITKRAAEDTPWSGAIKEALGTFTLSRKIKKHLIAQKQVGYELGKKRGKICAKNIGRIYAGHNQPRIFKEKCASKIQQDTAIFILGDCSGSMCGDRYETSACCQISMSEVLSVLQIPHMMMQFSTGGRSRKHFIMKYFTERGVSRDTLLQRYGSHGIGMGCNADGEAVTEAAQILARRPETNRILIVLSDGSPVYMSGGDQFLTDTVKEIEDSGVVSVIGIGIQTHSVKRYYKTSKVIMELSELEGVLLNLLKETVLK